MNYNLTSLNKETYIKTPAPYMLAEHPTSLDNIQSIEQDYIDLFSYTKRGHMAKYVHKYRPDIYENVFKQDTYYPFKMECELLAKNTDRLSRSLQDITQALEIGPGSYSPVVLKTVPLLKALLAHHPSFSTYKALDSSREYAEQACQIVQSQFSTINTEAIGIDFLNENSFRPPKIDFTINGKQLIFYFGQIIFGNNNDSDIKIFLNKIGAMLRQGDYLLFGIDTNKDEKILEAAYNTKISYELLLNTMHYLKEKIILKNFNPEAFEFVYKWNREVSTVEHYLKSTTKQILNINRKELVIDKGNIFNILNSRKMSIEQIEKFLDLANIKIKEVISLDKHQQNKFSIIITCKNK